MTVIQKFTRTCFGYTSIVSACVFVSLAPFLLSAPLPHATPRFHAGPVSLLLIAVRELILVMPAVLSVVTGMAWWSLRKGLSSARPRALAASISCLVMSTPFFVADISIARYSLSGPVEFTGVLLLFVAMLSIGITGIVAFSKRSLPRAASVAPTVNDVPYIGALAPTA